MIDLIHVHPMLVHFPIVLFTMAVVMQLLVLLRHGDLAANTCLANTAFASLLLAALAAVVAAGFGHVALHHAVEIGFPEEPLETHEGLGTSTMTFMLMLSAVHLGIRYLHKPLSGGRGWLLWVVALLGMVLLTVTAYYGGNLVYQIGVNVKGVTP